MKKLLLIIFVIFLILYYKENIINSYKITKEVKKQNNVENKINSIINNKEIEEKESIEDIIKIKNIKFLSNNLSSINCYIKNVEVEVENISKKNIKQVVL